MEQATITAGRRQLTLAGKHPPYLEYINGSDADAGMLATVIADLPAGSVLFDVGANIGFTAMSMGVQRPDCRVIAFEGVPSNAALLRQNIQANGLTNVEVVEAAVSDRRGHLMMTDNGPWSVASASVGAVKSQAVMLDDYIQPNVRFLKIDVEGFEPNVLAGATELLTTGRPLIAMEFNSYALLLHHYDPLVFAKALWAAYNVEAVYRDDKRQDLPPSAEHFFYTNLIPHSCVSDILIRPREKLPSLSEMVESPAMQKLRREPKGFLSRLFRQ